MENGKIKIVVGTINENSNVGRILQIYKENKEELLDFIGFADERQQLIDAINNATHENATHFSIQDIGFWCSLTFCKFKNDDKLYCNGTILKHHHAMEYNEHYNDDFRGLKSKMNAFRMISLGRKEQDEKLGYLLEVEIEIAEEVN